MLVVSTAAAHKRKLSCYPTLLLKKFFFEDAHLMSQHQRSRRLLFVADPSMALLDVVAELLFTLRERHPDLAISALFLNKKNADQVDPADTVGAFAASLFDEFILFENDRMTTYPSLSAMRHRRFRSLKAFARPDAIDAIQTFNAVILDPNAEEKLELQLLLNRIPGQVPFFYFEHGLNPKLPDSPVINLAGQRVRTLYVPFHNSDFNRFIALNAAVKKVGLLRTHKSYVFRAKERSRSMHNNPPANSALILARPMPLDALREHLCTLHESLWVRRGIPLVIRAHPKSAGKSKGGDIRSCLPTELEGKSWTVSRGHPSHLAEYAVLAIGPSSLSYDLAKSGVPVIDYPFNDEWPEYRDVGLVISASNPDELEIAIDLALGGEACGQLSAAADALVIDPPNLEMVCSDLSAAIFGVI